MNDTIIEAIPPRTLSERTRVAAQQCLAGRRKGPRALLAFAGPAITASIAYMDPGNFATNIQAGARYGYTLLWVVTLANAVAMLFQMLSARLGLVTGRNLAELCRERLPAPLVIALWVLSEAAAMATDLAEFVGAAIGLSLLFGLPLMPAMIVTAIVTYALLQFERAGFRPLELIIAALVGVIGISYLAELAITPVNWRSALAGTLVPQSLDHDALVLAVGIVGATVMPHVLFLHSGLVQDRVSARSTAERNALIRYSNFEVVCALGVAGLINMAMVIMASGAFHANHPAIAELASAYRTLLPLFGTGSALLFAIALIASGISSSVVGTVAGQMIMQGFVDFHIPLWLRRALTVAPAFIVIGSGVDPTRALVFSQVALSIALPLPMVLLVWFTSDRRVMGAYRNRPPVTVLASVGAALVMLLNGALIWQTFR